MDASVLEELCKGRAIDGGSRARRRVSSVFRVPSYCWNKHWEKHTEIPTVIQMCQHLGTLLGLSHWSGFDNLRCACKHRQIGRWFGSATILSCNLGGTNEWIRKLQGASCAVQIQGGSLDSNLSFCPSHCSCRELLVLMLHVTQGERVCVGFRVCHPLLLLSDLAICDTAPS